MVSNSEAPLIDVRTLEEYAFVGSPALEGDGDPIAYLISWEFLDRFDDDGNLIYKKNPDFDALVEQTFGDDKNQPLIIICRSGNRSSYAASRLEERGFTNIYEVDNKLKELVSFPGGRGGVQGSGYKGLYNGYRGFPGRLPTESETDHHKVESITNEIDDEHDSVVWMDSGLPITQKIDPEKIPKLKKEKILNSNNETFLRSQISIPFMANQSLANYIPQSYFAPSIQFPSYQGFYNINNPISLTGYRSLSSNFAPGFPQTFYPLNQIVSFNNLFNMGFVPAPSQRSSNMTSPQTQRSECGG